MIYNKALMINTMPESFFNSLKSKTRNPFFGTYLIIWMIRNWELVYSVFNFHPNLSREAKVQFIKDYYTNHPFWMGILITVGYTFLAMITSYLMMNLSRGLVNLSEEHLKPLIYKITDSKSIILKTKQLEMENQINLLVNSLEQERKAKAEIEMRLNELDNGKLTPVPVEEEESENETIKEDDITSAINQLINKKMTKQFITDGTHILRQKKFDDNYQGIDVYLQLGLIYLTATFPNYTQEFNFTALGSKVFYKLNSDKKYF